MPTHNASIREICTVSKVTETIKSILEAKLPIVWICGEISNLKIPASGHAYFTLKDEKAQIAAVMFRGQVRLLKFDLEDGATIVGMGRISVYAPRGTYQIILEYIEPQGLGALQLAFEQLKRKLSAEGLFDTVHKKQIPFLSHRVAIITSPSGAVLRDLLTIINRRFCNTAVDIYPVRVQGASAAREITKALELVNRHSKADVIVLARGGGSLEDLAAFNTESVARAIFSSNIPVVSAVGHETDFTIADFVADLRAPTPSAAAEMILPVKDELLKHCAQLRNRCIGGILRQCKDHRKRLESIRRHLIHPRKSLQDSLIRVDDLTQRLSQAMISFHRNRIERYRYCFKNLITASPSQKISKLKSEIEIKNYKLSGLIIKNISVRKHQYQILMTSLTALDPYAILKRGYSITQTRPQAMVVLDSAAVSSGQELKIILAKGCLSVNVKDQRPDWDLEKG